MECTCPPEDKSFYDLGDLCHCEFCDVDLLDHSITICRACKLPKGNLTKQEEHEFTYDDNYPYEDRVL